MNQLPRVAMHSIVRTSVASIEHMQHGAVGNVLVAVAGGVLVLAGFVTLFLPGPGLLMMLGGLSLLSTRFAFARRWLDYAQQKVNHLRRPRP